MSKSRERRKEEGEMNLIVNVAGAIQILKTCRSQKNLPRDDPRVYLYIVNVNMDHHACLPIVFRAI
jgi:hypothetical protein